MAAIRIEPIALRGNFIGQKRGAVSNVTVTSTALSGGSRVTIDAPGLTHILCFAYDDNIIVEVGADPTASDANGYVIPLGTSRPIPCENGYLVSAKTYAPPV